MTCPHRPRWPNGHMVESLSLSLSLYLREDRAALFPGHNRSVFGHDVSILSTIELVMQVLGALCAVSGASRTMADLRRLFRFMLGAHNLPVEMGRRLCIPQVARTCPLCLGMHVGDQRHYGLHCPLLGDIRNPHSRLFDDSHEAMRLFVWHRNQKSVASCLLQVLDRIVWADDQPLVSKYIIRLQDHLVACAS